MLARGTATTILVALTIASTAAVGRDSQKPAKLDSGVEHCRSINDEQTRKRCHEQAASDSFPFDHLTASRSNACMPATHSRKYLLSALRTPKVMLNRQPRPTAARKKMRAGVHRLLSIVHQQARDCSPCAHQIQRVIINLVKNAIEAMRSISPDRRS